MNKSFCKLSVIAVLLGLMFSLFSCCGDITYKDAEYPEQRIYMPTAYLNNGQLVIDDITKTRGDLAIEGNPYKYVLDMAKNEFRVPLSAYRAGINNDGALTITVNANTDVIATINEDRTDPYLLIPADKYSLVNSVEMKSGEGIAKFDLIVDLDFLRDNPNRIYAIGVEVSSDQIEVNPDLSTTAVIIHSKIMTPVANFSFSIDPDDKKKIFFNNRSLMSEEYLWDFGDGATSTEVSPAHEYSDYGTYTVTLTATGITGDEDKTVKTEAILVAEYVPEMLNIVSVNPTPMMTVVEQIENYFRFIVTGRASYAITSGFTRILPPEAVIFSFEYRNTMAVNELQIYLGTGTGFSATAINLGIVPVSEEWTEYTVDLTDSRSNWGNIGDNLRIHFGQAQSVGMEMEVRNIHFKFKD